MSRRKDKTSPNFEEQPAAPAENQPQEAAAAEETAPDTEALAKELADAKAKILYVQADYMNYRKRAAKDIAEARILGEENAVLPFTKVFDYLEMAKCAVEQSDNLEAIKTGVMMIIGEYAKAFEELGVVKFSTVGTKFDPITAEAVDYEASETVPEGVVLREFSGGYKCNGRLLRPARVVVSSGAPAAAVSDVSSESFPPVGIDAE